MKTKRRSSKTKKINCKNKKTKRCKTINRKSRKAKKTKIYSMIGG